MNTILVPIDFSDASRAVVKEAARLARFSKGRLILVHVVQPPVIVSDYGLAFENVMEITAAAEKDADRYLARLREKLRADGVRVETVRLNGIPVWTILGQAKKSRANYIVMGSHGHTAFYDLLAGSTTSGVLKRATCPVVVVPSPRKVSRKASR